MTLFKTTIKLYDIGNFHGSQHRFEIIIVFGQICSLIDKLEFIQTIIQNIQAKLTSCALI